MKIFAAFFLLSIFYSPYVNAKTVDIRNSMANIVNKAFFAQAQNDKVIAYAAKNKVYSQQIAKDAVLIVSHIRSEENYAQMLNAAKNFDMFLDSLFNANEKLGIKKATDPAVLKEANEILSEWKIFYPFVVKFFKNGEVNPDSYRYILDNNEKLLRLSHKLTQTLKSKRVMDTTLNKVVEHSLKIVDRQRMLTQKMFKEKLLIYNNIDKARNKIRIKGSIILFENGLKGLLHGDKKRGLIQVTNDKIYKKLQTAWRLWRAVEKIYRNPNPSKEDILKLAKYEPKLLKISNELVTSIEESLGIL